MHGRVEIAYALRHLHSAAIILEASGKPASAQLPRSTRSVVAGPCVEPWAWASILGILYYSSQRISFSEVRYVLVGERCLLGDATSAQTRSLVIGMQLYSTQWALALLCSGRHSCLKATRLRSDLLTESTQRQAAGQRDVAWRSVAWRGVAWRWRGVAWLGVGESTIVGNLYISTGMVASWS